MKFVSYPRNLSAVENHPDKHSTQVLRWFSQGKYFVEQNNDTLNFYNAKWGRGDFRATAPDRAMVFNYLIYPNNSGWKVTVRQPDMNREQFWSAFGALWRRMFDAGQW